MCKIQYQRDFLLSLKSKSNNVPVPQDLSTNSADLLTTIHHQVKTKSPRSRDISDIVQEVTEDTQTLVSDTCIILGDFNCRIDTINHKGNTLINLMNSKQFRLINNPNEHTYFAHNGQSCIDLIFIRSNKSKVVKEFQVLKDPLKKHQRVKTAVRVKSSNQSTLVNSSTVKEQISRKVNLLKVQKDPLTSSLSPENTDDIKNLTKILTDAAKKNPKTKKHHKPWFDGDCKILKQRNLRLMQETNKTLNRTDAQKEYKTMLKNKRLSYEEKELLEKCKNAQLKPWEMFDKKFGSPSINISILEEHFQKLLNVDQGNIHEEESPVDTSGEEWYNQDITLCELQNAIKSLKNKKAAGLDQVFNEHVKETFDYFQEWWLIYMNNLLNTGTIPTCWRTAKLKTLYKGKGNIKDPNMYRGIALISVTYKVYTKILNNRIINNIDSGLPNEQYGFRKARNCQQAIEVLRIKIKENLDKPKGKMYCTFVDFQKAFDSINRNLLLKTLKDTNIKGKIYNAVRNIISSNFLQVDNGTETSNKTLCQNIGVIQGDPLSATLFIIYVKTIPETIKKSDVDTLMYADDLVLFSNNLAALQESINNLSDWCSSHKLYINQSKTKIMKFRNGGKLTKDDIIHLNTTTLDFVNEYEYLGVVMQPSLTITKHIITKSIKASHAIGTITNMQYLSLDTLHKIFYMKIWPILTYSFNILARDLTCQQLIELDKVKAKYYKKALGVHKSTSNTLVLHMAETERMGVEVIEKYGNYIKTEHKEEYQKKIEEKNMKFTVENYTDGPIFRSNTWKKYGQSNRHILARYTSHGFHHRICNKKTYHTTFENCICTICNQPISDRYHLNIHILSSNSTLTSLITSLDKNV
ncbi:hypothetical protein M8J77_019893 [Diaphorina citri]|nr:hypothetical protein M8J77_019893 [Diaphorina citri]